jgi:formylglycine-generating enzyme required for sulfatase activity
MSSKVFISYRRDDSRWQAREIYRALGQVLPRDHVFMDVDSIPPGADFVDVLESWVDECHILLALIGSGWLDATDPKTGRRRLENPNDFVRIEVRKALARGIPVVPVLLDGADIPDVEKLPDDLKRLVRRNAEFVTHRTVDADVARLIKRLGLGDAASAPAVVGSREGARPDLRPVDAAPAIVATPDPAERYRAEGRIKIDAKIIHGAPDGWFLPGNGKNEWFQDIEGGPRMVVVPTGTFMMGSSEGEGEYTEWPQHRVTFAQPFAVGIAPVTRGEFYAVVAATNHDISGDPGSAQMDDHPVVRVSWLDAELYTLWLAEKTGNKHYRLPSEAEWEYACRATTATPYNTGSEITTAQANFDQHYKGTTPIAKFPANLWGLHDTSGNVWEWTADHWHGDYDGAPSDGAAWSEDEQSLSRVIRGSSWMGDPWFLRSAFRNHSPHFNRAEHIGFRVARSLNP